MSIKKILLANADGATLGLDYRPRYFKTGYAVSLTDNRLQNWQTLSTAELHVKLAKLKKLAKQMGLKTYFIGWWVDDGGTGCLDLTVIKARKAEALKLARVYHQEAIFSFAKMNTIYTN